MFIALIPSEGVLAWAVFPKIVVFMTIWVGAPTTVVPTGWLASTA